MTVQTSYAKKDNPDNFNGGYMQQSRLIYFISDTLKNYFSDPNNIKDERIAALLYPKGPSQEATAKLFRIGLPYSPLTKTLCETPSISVSLGDIGYIAAPFNVSVAGAINTPDGTASRNIAYKRINFVVSIATETYIGTIQLAELVEMWMKANEINLVQSCKAISEFHVMGASVPLKISAGEQLNAKDVYQSSINLYVVGGLSWTSDTQGPVFRGIKTTVAIR